MLFNSPDFIIFFVFILAILPVIKYRKYQHLFLLIASYFFFYFSSNYLITLLIFSTILDFQIGRMIYDTKSISRKKTLLILSLVGNLGLLGFFKYVDFSIDQINNLTNLLGFPTDIPFLNLILPIGISFYTFQTISYTVDIYRGKLKPSKTFLEFALFVSFFPQLVAGPIVRASEFLPQLREKIENFQTGHKLRSITIQYSNLKIGITLMAFGFIKKMFFADNIAPMANDIFTNPIGSESFTIIIGALAFGMQIYGDFSGYSDIAIGAALILGFKLPINFNKPYFASSPSDFWKKWHISLSRWLRDYFYIPLGGNKKSRDRTYLNLMTVMFFGGLWHGASVNFIIWGLLHGGYLAIHKIIENKFPGLTKHSFFKSKKGKIISIFITQYFVFLAWIPFRVKDIDYMFYSMSKYILLDFEVIGTLEFISSHKVPFLLMLIFIAINYFSYRHGNLLQSISNLKIKYWFIFIFVTILAILFMYDGNSEMFVYFQF
jgi:alginate O-acetyltransferase complex protein AlgI